MTHPDPGFLRWCRDCGIPGASNYMCGLRCVPCFAEAGRQRQRAYRARKALAMAGC